MLHKDYFGLYNLWDFTNLIYVYIYAFYFEFERHVLTCMRMVSTTETCSIY
jgi:hypothetical protein